MIVMNVMVIVQIGQVLVDTDNVIGGDNSKAPDT